MVISPWSWSSSLKVEKLWSSNLSGGEVEEKWRRSGAVEKAPAMHKLSDSSLSGIIVDIIIRIVNIITLITINNSVDHLHYQYSTMIDWSSLLLCTVDNDQTKKPQIIRFRFVIVFGFFLSSRRVDDKIMKIVYSWDEAVASSERLIIRSVVLESGHMCIFILMILFRSAGQMYKYTVFTILSQTLRLDKKNPNTKTNLNLIV